MAKSYEHLDMQERAVIETQLGFGMKPGAIAVGLLRSRSTITREIKRNGWRPSSIHCGRPTIAGGYRAVQSNRRAQRLAGKPRVARRLAPGTDLWNIVVDHLRQGLSPAQIASTLARMPDPVRLSHETIYPLLRHASRPSTS